jgi:hypothetical protein
MNDATRKYWFPAKRYGWGWGPPIVWQGWVAVAIFFILLAGGAFFLMPSRGAPVFVAYSMVLSVALVLVCWITGEPPRWRWGGK